MMIVKEFEKAVAEGKKFEMCKYLGYGAWSTPQIVTAERAKKKAKVRTPEGYCPYSFRAID